MIDPLTDFAQWGRPAPFLAKRPKYDFHALVVPVRSKTGLVAAKRGGIAHLDDGIAAVFRHGRARFGARYFCGPGTTDAVVLADARAYGDLICEFCVDAKLGPGVYRCFNAASRLIYIGASVTPLRRQKAHEARSSWWPEVADVQVTRYPTLFQARAAERLAIVAEDPVYNRLPRKRGAA